MKFLKQRKTRFLALLLSGTMLATAFTAMPVSASNTSATASSVVEHFEFLGDNQVSFANEFLQNFYQEIGAVNASDIVRRDALSRHEFSNDDRDALLTTLAAPMGAIGFEGEFSLDNPDEMILVWVSFRTPSSLALRLLAEDDFPRARFSDEVFEATALEAHDAFDEQLATLMPDTGIMALSSNTFEIWGRYSLVFNGVLMNVPMGMVEAIASLPEVFAVTPEVEAVLIGEVEDAEDNADMIMAAIESLTPSNEQELTDEYELIDDELTNDDTEYYSEDDYEILDNEEDDDDDEEAAEEVVATHVDAPIAIMPTYQSIQPAYLLFHPEFNRGARDLFELDDIHLGVTTGSPVTGVGITVAVIDSGVDYRNPVFFNSLVPSSRYTPGLGFLTMEGGAFLFQDPITGPDTGGNGSIHSQPHLDDGFGFRRYGAGESPMEGVTGNRNHGTHVAGIVVGMAPDAKIIGYRAISAGQNHPVYGNSVMNSLTDIFDRGDVNVVNMSFGSRQNTPWLQNALAVSTMALSGIVMVSASGNDAQNDQGAALPGWGGWFTTGGGTPASALGITVGSTPAGGRQTLGFATVDIDSTTVTTRIIGHHPTFNVNTTLSGLGNIPYVWFGQLGSPDAVPGNPLGFGDSHFLPMPTNPNFQAAIDNIALNLASNGIDLTGGVAIFNRGGTNFDSMRELATQLGAIAMMIVNHENHNVLVSGTVLNNINNDQTLPNLSIGRDDGEFLFGPHTTNSGPFLEGTLNLGTASLVGALEILTPSSGLGPIGPLGPNSTMHIKPDIIAPGVRVFSAENMDRIFQRQGNHDDPFVEMGGTSMSSPAIAGIAALMLEHFGTLTSTAEIKARMMNTARPLADFSGFYSVHQVGAGLVQPQRIFDPAFHNIFATAIHPVPFEGGGIVGGTVPGTTPGGTWEMQQMASLSFGSYSALAGTSMTTATIRVTIEDGGAGHAWTPSYNMFIPSQEVLPPRQGLTQAQWGPALPRTITGVTFNIDIVSATEFDVHIVHDGSIVNSGHVEGYLTFNNGLGVSLSMPFAANFTAMPVPAPLVPLTSPNVGIWRPIISGYTTTQDNFVAGGNPEDPRLVAIRALPWSWDYAPGDEHALSTSNYSGVTFGFSADGGPNVARTVRFYVAPQGGSIGDPETQFHMQFNNIAPDSLVFSHNLLSSVVGGMRYTFGIPELNATGLVNAGLWVDWGTPLEPGIYDLIMHVVHETPGYGLEMPFTFIVADHDNGPRFLPDEDVFTFADGGTSVIIGGNIYSSDIELAMANNLRVATTLGTNPNSPIPTFAPVSYGITAVHFPQLNDVLFTPSMANIDGRIDVVLNIGTGAGQWVPPSVHTTPLPVDAIVREGIGVGGVSGVGFFMNPIWFQGTQFGPRTDSFVVSTVSAVEANSPSISPTSAVFNYFSRNDVEFDVNLGIGAFEATDVRNVMFNGNLVAGWSFGSNNVLTLYPAMFDAIGVSAGDVIDLVVNFNNDRGISARTITVIVPSVTIINGGVGSEVTGGPTQLEGNSAVTINAGARAGFAFNGWTFNQPVTLTSGSTVTATTTSFILPDSDIIATAHWIPEVPTAPGVPPVTPPTPPAPPVTPPTPPETPEVPPVTPPTPPTPPIFTDVSPDAWYADFIEEVVEAGVFAGVGEGLFNPNGVMTRAMFVQALANLHGVDLTEFTGISRFSDVDVNAWYAASVEWAASLGVVVGMGDGTFRPNAPVTREQIALMLFKFIQLMGIEVTMGEVLTFVDEAEISFWAAEAVASIQAMGIVSGRPNGSFDPQATATRAEVATMFARLLTAMR